MASLVNADLTRFLVGYTARPFIWGRDDCCLFLADWWRMNYPPDDPASHVRATYSDEDGKSRLVASAGGLVNLVSGIADKAGAKETETPRRGDFAVIQIGSHDPTGSICSTDRYWAIRTPDGIGFIPTPKILRAWAI